MRMFTVYKNPRDYPGAYVVREFTLRASAPLPHTQALYIGDSLAMARATIQEEVPGAVAIERSAGDEPQILETWL